MISEEAQRVASGALVVARHLHAMAAARDAPREAMVMAGRAAGIADEAVALWEETKGIEERVQKTRDARIAEEAVSLSRALPSSSPSRIAEEVYRR